jgi:hypothetical protein
MKLMHIHAGGPRNHSDRIRLVAQTPNCRGPSITKVEDRALPSGEAVPFLTGTPLGSISDYA